jgi:hypothetical protein
MSFKKSRVQLYLEACVENPLPVMYICNDEKETQAWPWQLGAVDIRLKNRSPRFESRQGIWEIKALLLCIIDLIV